MIGDVEPVGRAPGAASEASEAGDVQSRRVAVLIMVVTLLGSVFAFLQTSASNRAALAMRRSEAAAVGSISGLALSESHIAMEGQLWALANEEGALGVSLRESAGGDLGETATMLAEAFTARAQAMLPFSDLASNYQTAEGIVNWNLFVQEALAPSIRAAEFQLAYAEERDGWGAKGGIYVAVVTVLAVALFLIGLSRTIASGSGRPLVAAGSILAGVAALWGSIVFLRPVAAPSAEAIDAYVDGVVSFNSVLADTEPARARPALMNAAVSFTRAITLRPDYIEAYRARGAALFRLDLLQDGGPDGSEQAAEDIARAVADNPLDPIAWGNLGATRFWLGDLEEAGAATRRALAIDPEDLTFNLNLGLFLALRDDPAAYQAQVARIREVMAADDVTTWMRQIVVTQFVEVLDLAETYRPEMAEAVRGYREEVLRIEHQISVGKRFFGTAVPAPVAAAVSPLTFTLSEDRTQLLATFDATGVVAGQRWLWRTYLNGVESTLLSHEPEVWPFAVPDQQATITLTLADGFPAGVPVRVEVFIEGNLLQVGEYTP